MQSCAGHSHVDLWSAHRNPGILLPRVLQGCLLAHTRSDRGESNARRATPIVRGSGARPEFAAVRPLTVISGQLRYGRAMTSVPGAVPRRRPRSALARVAYGELPRETR